MNFIHNERKLYMYVYIPIKYWMAKCLKREQSRKMELFQSMYMEGDILI